MNTVAWADTCIYRVYHIRSVSGESIYVGQSDDVFRRLAEHRNSGKNNHALWEYLRKCDADELRVDLYTLVDCEDETGEKGKDAVNWMESSLIGKYAPTYNRRDMRFIRKRYHEHKLPMGLTDNIY